MGGVFGCFDLAALLRLPHLKFYLFVCFWNELGWVLLQPPWCVVFALVTLLPTYGLIILLRTADMLKGGDLSGGKWDAVLQTGTGTACSARRDQLAFGCFRRKHVIGAVVDARCYFVSMPSRRGPSLQVRCSHLAHPQCPWLHALNGTFVHALTVAFPGLPGSEIQSQIDAFTSFNCVLEGNAACLLSDTFLQRSFAPGAEFQAVSVTSTDHICIEGGGYLDLFISGPSYPLLGIQGAKVDSAAGAHACASICFSSKNGGGKGLTYPAIHVGPSYITSVDLVRAEPKQLGKVRTSATRHPVRLAHR